MQYYIELSSIDYLSFSSIQEVRFGKEFRLLVVLQTLHFEFVLS